MEKNVQITVGVSDAKVSADREDSLITYSLGSCIGVCLYDAQNGIGGMLHYQLPSSTADPLRAVERPLMFADTGMQWLMERMERTGANKRRFKVWLAGGAQMLNDQHTFDIGRRNHTAIRKVLWQMRLLIDGEQIGGQLPRTLTMNLMDGSVSIRSGGESMLL